jgi:hypothetical protein
MSRNSGPDSVSVNGFRVSFELGADCSLYGFLIDTLRAAKYRAPIVREYDGMPRIDGWEDRSVYAVDVEI